MSWQCTWCGRVYDDTEEPSSCETCKRETFESVAGTAETPDETVETGEEYIWVCPACDREHVKNNPPCSRCLNPTLEKREPDYADISRDLDVPSWFEVAKPYTPILVIVMVVVGLFATGVVPVTVLPGIGTDVPGSADETDGIEHSEVEAAVHGLLEDHRADADEPSRTYNDELASYATAYNQQLAIANYGEGEPTRPDPADYDLPCEDRPHEAPLLTLESSIDAYGSSDDLANDIATAMLESEVGETVTDEFADEGLDVHVGPDRTVHVLYVTC